MNHNDERVALFTPFWPLGLMAISLVVFLGWQVVAAAQQYISLVRLSDQQAVLTSQATQAETKLQTMMMDLLKLSLSNPEAKAIVNKYGIKFNSTAQSAAPGAPALPSPRAKAKVQEDAKPVPKPVAEGAGTAEQ
jgi:hypothetical protein